MNSKVKVKQNKNFPLISVICLAYNHESFIKKALESIYLQTYPNIEILIVDDFSSDKSVKVIQKFIKEIPLYKEALEEQKSHFIRKIHFIQNKKNLGNCISFNKAFFQSKGKYIIDFATDDILKPERIERQVELFKNLDKSYGVIFSNALRINEDGKVLKYHFPVNESEKTNLDIPQGDIYESILQKYFIPTPSMMIKREVLENLKGYDESLSYEDFDFWIRSSRKYKYYFQNEVLTLWRKTKNSHGSKFYLKKQNPHLQSTLIVCQKAIKLNQNEDENKALAKCINYHLRQAFYMQCFSLVKDYYNLLKKINTQASQTTKMILTLSKLKIPVFWAYRLYLKIKR